MNPAQPVGAPLPGAGELPEQVRPGAASSGWERPFSVYLHVPYCRVRCGYCDFNTYTNLAMGGGASASDYVDTLAGELRLARRAMDRVGLPRRAPRTVFVGGGTPTMLPVGDLARMLRLVRDTWGLAEGAEVTTEANPETVDERYLAALAQAGFTRVSFGMQSAVPHVLRTLDRTHTPERVPQVVAWARRAGLDTSLDLIYGTPGESMEDWRRSLQAAVEIGPDHLSAYALVIEEGTRMWAQVRRGELPLPTDDDEAAKYELADALLSGAGYEWYEISNWARPGHECLHNQAYWRDWDWWGAGPGAHSHLGDARIWNTKHPVAWAGQVAYGQLPVAGHEVIDAESRELERVMLGIRTREGLDLAGLTRLGEETTAEGAPRRLVGAIGKFVAQGLLDGVAAKAGRVVLTLRGRLMADTVTRALVY
ncbi:radical SAM family heme chaperone HemW [Actinomyces qiguomingii]|uniref:radical SAM family heme chaperone HemW n=1 Tax=Actinomyces qiguomingii TaxID=2057800 RepID=UPI000CA081BC|nr:radical SAM family heme chaperone HemW [Actinomyces qiguomingii]